MGGGWYTGILIRVKLPCQFYRAPALPHLGKSVRKRTILNAEFDILIVVAEAAPEYGQPADMLGGIRYLHAEEELVPVIEVQLIDTYVGKAFIVHKYAVAVDGQRFQQTVLVPVGKPPVRREQSLYICVVPGTCPDADKCIIQIEMYIRSILL